MNDVAVNKTARGALFAQAAAAWVERGTSDAPPARSSAMRHMASIRALADEVGRPYDEVGRPYDEVAWIYQCELARLAAHAVVLDFVPVLVAKRVRHMYQHRLDALHQHDPCAALLAAAGVKAI